MTSPPQFRKNQIDDIAGSMKFGRKFSSTLMHSLFNSFFLWLPSKSEPIQFDFFLWFDWINLKRSSWKKKERKGGNVMRTPMTFTTKKKSQKKKRKYFLEKKRTRGDAGVNCKSVPTVPFSGIFPLKTKKRAKKQKKKKRKVPLCSRVFFWSFFYR